MATIGKGTKMKFSLAVSGLGEMSLADNSVDFRIDFYAREKKDSPVNNYYTVKKSDTGKAFPNDEDSDSYFVICDTSKLDLGTIGATLMIEYTDEDTNVRLKELVPLTSQVVIVPALQAPIEADYEVVKVVSDERDLDDSVEYAENVYGAVEGADSLFQWDGDSWESGPSVTTGTVIADTTTGHVYVADANQRWEDKGVIAYTLKD